LGEEHRTLSWIWYNRQPVKDGEEATNPELVEGALALRVEWCKAYARMCRWYEDVVLTEEEMRRTIEYGRWAGAQWIIRAGARRGTVDEELLEGLQAYSREQEARESRTCTELTAKW
ncbi:hypothetical protein K438DRAFT_1498209, partial [Mycena galopus ATCC 62051]